MRNSAFRRNLPVILSVSAALAFYIIFILRTSFSYEGIKHYTLIDDAMISMRYAKHFAEGAGLVWNVGGEMVQGYTNLLWTVYFSFVHSVFHDADAVSLAIMLTGVLILVLNGLYIGKIALLVTRDETASLFAMLFTLFLYPLVFWTLRGMETGLASLVLSVSVYYALSGKWLFTCIGLFLLPAVRMDCVLSGGLIGVFSFLTFRRKGSLPLFSLILGLGAVLLFQKLYYGHTLPNTYLLKVEGVSQTEKTALGLKVFVSNVLPFVVVPLGAVLLYFRKNSVYILLLGIFVLQTVYSVYVGGDYAEENTKSVNRFIVISLPFLAVLFLGIFSGRMVLIMFAVLILPFSADFYKWATHNAPLLDSDIRRAKVGMMIDRYTADDAIIAVHGAGNIGYYSDRFAVDILGKNDSYIASQKPKAPFRPGHNKWDYDYAVIRMRADLVADEWGKTAEFMKTHPEYLRLKNGIRTYTKSEKIKDLKALGGER